MAKDKKYRRMINYTGRDFQTIKKDLEEMARRYYPDTYKDFSEASFGSLMVDSVAYIGDMLSFYLDYNVNESFMDTATEYNNIVRHARQSGYQFMGRTSAQGVVIFYILVPASSTGLGPNSTYIPTLKRGTQVKSEGGSSFILTENVDFNHPRNEVVAARTDTATGLPTHYAIRARGRVISGKLSSENVEVGDYTPFLKLKLKGSNIAEIMSVVDSQGNEYQQVDFLSQDVVYREVVNKNVASDNVQSVLKPYAVPRRFILERQRISAYLQFGFGSDSEIASPSVVEPKNFVLDVFGRDYITDKSFDPSKLIRTDKFGVVPSNTTLTVRYRTISPVDTNASAGSVTSITNAVFQFPNTNATSRSQRSEVTTSLEVFNDEPITGDVSFPGKSEIKRLANDHFAAQNRAVTKADYEALVYAMDPKFGTVKRCNIVRDANSLKRNLNMYVISQDESEKLVVANDTIKKNLKTWLNKYRMINDTLDILDAYIINIEIDFSFVAVADKNKYEVLELCLQTLRSKYNSHFYIGEPFYISDIYRTLNKVEGVVDVLRVRVKQKKGTNYSTTNFDIPENTSACGTYIKVPENVILEIKYLANDIRGSVK